MNPITYQVFNMHGPTVHRSDSDGFEKLVRDTFRSSVNAGPYRVVYLPTGEVVARFDRDMYGNVRRGYDTLEDALNR
jgi:hypothetical protein